MFKSYQISAILWLVIVCYAIAIGNCDNLDLFANLEHNVPNSSFILYSTSLPNETAFTPTLSNGHIGFTVLDDSIYINGIYNGKKGLSHRARIPNFANLSIVARNDQSCWNKSYSMNLKTGVFQVRTENQQTEIIQLTYPHRYYTKSIIHEVFIYRKQISGSVTFKVHQLPGSDSQDIEFLPYNFTKFMESSSQHSYGGETNVPEVIALNRANSKLTEPLPTDITNGDINTLRGYTLEKENDEFQKSRTPVCIVSNVFPKLITLNKNSLYTSFKYVMAIDEDCILATRDIEAVLQETSTSLLNLHSMQWKNFWDSFSITVTGNINLSQTINAGIFYLASNMPSINSYQENKPYFGLSPGGLGRGGYLADYQGHSFWDTESWMLPPVTQLNPSWTRDLLNYRYRHLEAAKYNARTTGFDGARYPWESAYTGTEATNPCCPDLAAQQLHITGDIGFAVEQYFSVTHDTAWLHREGCPLATNIAAFWASSVRFNNATKKYDIPNVMGPDEDHYNITNNAYTNVIAGYALKFGEFARTICDPNVYPYMTETKWIDIANNLELLYNSTLDYHPEFYGYTPNVEIKQADVILLGYPLQFPMNQVTRANDLKIYENVTRSSGPAMTWSMHSINNMDIGDKTKADELFIKGYENYVREPFMVWSESIVGVPGSINFLTGIGGFLQALINGYGGVRIHIDHLEVRKSSTPPGSQDFNISGIKYLGSTFDISTTNNVSLIKCTSLNYQQPLTLSEGSTKIDVNRNLQYEIQSEHIKITPNKRNW